MLRFAFGETILTLISQSWAKRRVSMIRTVKMLSLTILLITVMVNDDRVLAQAGTWTNKASMPTPRSHFGVAEVNGVLYAVGGMKDRPCCPYPFIATVEAYDRMTDTWTPKASMPTARADLGVGVVNGVLYAVGGNNGDN